MPSKVDHEHMQGSEILQPMNNPETIAIYDRQKWSAGQQNTASPKLRSLDCAAYARVLRILTKDDCIVITRHASGTLAVSFVYVMISYRAPTLH